MSPQAATPHFSSVAAASFLHALEVELGGDVRLETEMFAALHVVRLKLKEVGLVPVQYKIEVACLARPKLEVDG
jgi:hypothetical protein